MSDRSHDAIVVGAGHAGCEAALALARLGQKTLLLTMSIDAIGWMSCNPAIGGQAKGQIVREIDALGGQMGKVTDRAAIQTRWLNTRKGPAVRAPRAQCDKRLYAAAIRWDLEREPRLSIRQDTVDDVLIEHGRAAGVRGASGIEYRARAVVLTTGTFLRGLMHTGESKREGGRAGAEAARHLSGNLARAGFEVARLKTGTPPRLHGRTVDYARMDRQDGETPPIRFSFSSDNDFLPQVPCWTTYTTAATHEAIRANLHRAPLYTGQIEGRGPRYCPSIEDKVVRFAERDRHIVFIEPEGLTTEEVYVNGISTSLPRDVQDEIVRTIPGLERAEITRYGYAVEYDFFPPAQLRPTLETRAVEGLFFAGQICGTSGYEEAAAQGIVAGINAARRLRGEREIVLGRDQAYVGVLVDDLVTMDHREPYRMFSSRAEHRLLLRAGNADRRLTPLGREIGLVGDAAWARFREKEALIAWVKDALALRREGGRTLAELLARPEVSFAHVEALAPEIAARPLPREVEEEVETEVKYAGYIARQLEHVERARRLEEKRIPEGFDFAAIPGLRREAREKLLRARPASLGQAGRIAGVTPADVAVLLVEMKRRAHVG
jgi:tRNA uridine 5-carboxymethylaminomethyl modification enzyme